MVKEIEIDGKPVGFRATALTPRLYRHKFGRDIIRDMGQLKKAYDKAVRSAGLVKPGPDATSEEQEAYQQAVNAAQMEVTDLEIFENFSFVMARQYDLDIPPTPEEWLDGFDTFSVYKVLPSILELWRLNELTTAKPKKK